MDVSRRQALSLSGSAVAALSLSAAGSVHALPVTGAGTRWWMDEPVRMALVLYDQTRPPLDTDAFVDWLADLGANAVVLPTGGVAAFYPTQIPFHATASALPPGRDLVGEIIRKAHARGIRVVSRFEWTVNQSKGLVEAHPDWVQRRADGSSPIWAGTHLMCVNGGYIRAQSFKIMGEVLARYPVDGFFFNWVGQRMNNGPCHCDNCQRRFRAHSGRAIPDKPDEEYLAFINACSAEATAQVTAFLREKRPDHGFNMMVGPDADSVNNETHSAPIASSHAYWLYQASETVNRLRSTTPNKMSFNNDAAFVDGYWRYAHRSVPDGEIRAYQNMANGAGPFLFVNGPIDQFDGHALKGAKPAFQFHKAHEKYYVRQENAARVLLLEDADAGSWRLYGDKAGPNAGNGGYGYRDSDGAGTPGDGSPTALRGFFRLLSEQHVPFALSSDLGWIDTDPGRYDLVVSYRGAPAALDRYLRQGGRLLVAGAEKPALELPPVVRLWPRQETLSSYWRVRDRKLLPSLADTDLMLNYSDWLELEPRGGNAALTFVPPTPTIPMERVGEGMADTAKPGLYLADYGRGRLAFLPWDIGDLYYRAGAVQHAALIGDLLDHLLPGGRQIRTNAHPMVQVTLQRQKQEGRTLLHLVNLSGCSQVSYHPAIPMSGIQLDVAGDFRSARLVSLGRDLPVRRMGGYASFTVPSLDTYDVVALT